MIEVKDICFSYDSSDRVILDNVGFNLEAGECLAILGNNGVGKSTLLKCIDRINKISSGSVIVKGKNVFTLSRREMAQNIAYVPQSTESSHIMVFDAVLLGRKPYIKWDVGDEDRLIVSEIIERFGLSEYKARYLNELSGGELQKVVLARAMAQQPLFLLLDEPTSNLDPKNQHEMLNTVKKLALEHRMGVAIVIHDLNLAMRYCDKFLFLKDGRVYSCGGIETVTPEAIDAVYDMKVEIIEYRDIKMVIPYQLIQEDIMMDKNKELWQKCAAFHGHVCGGLTIGYKAALYAIELMDIKFSKDEDVVCVSENDACGVDAIQVILGCSIGKGNLLFHMTGKQAFSFYDRKSGKSVRLVLKKKPEGMTREQSFDYYQSLEPREMFDVKDTKITLPESARLFDSYDCECCGETAGANWIRIQGGQKLCVDCLTKYDRFKV